MLGLPPMHRLAQPQCAQRPEQITLIRFSCPVVMRVWPVFYQPFPELGNYRIIAVRPIHAADKILGHEVPLLYRPVVCVLWVKPCVQMPGLPERSPFNRHSGIGIQL